MFTCWICETAHPSEGKLLVHISEEHPGEFRKLLDRVYARDDIKVADIVIDGNKVTTVLGVKDPNDPDDN